MAIFSKMVQQWHVTETGEVEICLLGLNMTTDSPKFLLLTVTCGLLSATLISGASRAFLCQVWKKACKMCSRLFVPSIPSAATRSLSPVPGGLTTAKSTTTKMGQKMTVTTSVQLSTDAFEPELDLLTSYEIIDLPRLRRRMRDAQTSPLNEAMRHDVGVGTLVVDMQDRACSPSSSIMYESASPSDLLLMFEGEEGESLKDGGAVSLGGDNSELYEKLGSIQKALQEANQEMDSYMSTLSEMSQRFSSSPAHLARGYSSAAPISAASADPNSALTWEDEFTTAESLPPPVRLSATTSSARNNYAQPYFEPEDLALWQSDLRFYSGLSSYPETDTRIEIDSSDPLYNPSNSLYTAGATRDSGCGDLWDTWETTEHRNHLVCSSCNRKEQRPSRPLSAPSSSGYSTPQTGGALSCDVLPESSSLCVLCHGSARSQSSHQSPDRVPKSRRN